jgi:acetyl-CoA carboxylase carboxyltransferase component
MGEDSSSPPPPSPAPSSSPPSTTTTTTAPSRLQQLSSHLNPTNTKKARKPRSQQEALPPDYSDVLAQISQLKAIASTPNTSNRGYIRQKTDGKLWVRERIEALVDKNSLAEIGSVAGMVEWQRLGPLSEKPIAFTPANNVQGFAKLNGRKVIFTADDFSIRAGHADGAMMEKTIYAEKMAIAMRLPMIKLVDGSSGGGSVTTIKKMGWSYIPHVSSMSKVAQQLNMGIPNLGAVLGPAVCYHIWKRGNCDT